MRNLLIASIILFLGIAPGKASFSEEVPEHIKVIVLKDGRVIQCDMGWIEGNTLLYRKSGGTMGIPLDRVDLDKTYRKSIDLEKAFAEDKEEEAIKEHRWRSKKKPKRKKSGGRDEYNLEDAIVSDGGRSFWIPDVVKVYNLSIFNRTIYSGAYESPDKRLVCFGHAYTVDYYYESRPDAGVIVKIEAIDKDGARLTPIDCSSACNGIRPGESKTVKVEHCGYAKCKVSLNDMHRIYRWRIWRVLVGSYKYYKPFHEQFKEKFGSGSK